MKINAKEIEGILNAIEQSDVEEVVIEQPNINLHIVRDISSLGKSKPSISKSTVGSSVADKVETTESIKPATLESDKSSSVDKDYKDILSPEVGIFLRYAKKSDGMLVKLRDEIKKGQTLAYIRSNGITYEIKSEYDGKITEILVEDEQAVEFAQPLFRLK